MTKDEKKIGKPPISFLRRVYESRPWRGGGRKKHGGLYVVLTYEWHPGRTAINTASISASWIKYPYFKNKIIYGLPAGMPWDEAKELERELKREN